MAKDLIGIIGGSGLADALAGELDNPRTVRLETPFGPPSEPPVVGTWGRYDVAFINRHGRGHRLNPSRVPYAANVFALKELGAKVLLATGAVGSLRTEMAPGDLVVVDQFIDKTYRRSSTFFDAVAAVHCEMAQPVCPRLGRAVVEAARQRGITTHDGGTYVCMEGPQFSTRAESLMHRAWGGDLIGMTAMPEAKLAREAQMCYGLICLVSDYDCWQAPSAEKSRQTLLEEIKANLHRASENCLSVLRAVLQGCDTLHDDHCACRKSLELAVWTPPDHVSPEERERLQVLFT